MSEKTVVLIRHAKSEDSKLNQKDYDRSLTERGKKDAHEMGERLKHDNLMPDAVLASSSLRTRMTTLAITTVLEFDASKIDWDLTIYHAQADKYEELILATSEDYNTIYLVGHNNGISDFAIQCLPQLPTHSLPTCGIVAFSFEGAWTDFSHAKLQLIKYDYPRK